MALCFASHDMAKALPPSPRFLCLASLAFPLPHFLASLPLPRFPCLASLASISLPRFPCLNFLASLPLPRLPCLALPCLPVCWRWISGGPLCRINTLFPVSEVLPGAGSSKTVENPLKKSTLDVFWVGNGLSAEVLLSTTHYYLSMLADGRK